MKILIITNNIKNIEAVKQGLQLAKDRTASIGYNFEYTFQASNKQFTGVHFSNATVGKGACVNPDEILYEVSGNYKIACLIYDWDNISPKPTNPVQSPIILRGCNPIQIPENWYNQEPEVLCQYFLHEICHSGYFFANNVTNDQTHSYIEAFSQKQRWEYYVHLLSQLKPFLETETNGFIESYPVLKKGMTGNYVQELQKILKEKGYFIYPFTTKYFGIITDSSVKAFQKDNGLYVDGIVGVKTWTLLKKKKTSLIDAIIEVESQGDINAIGDTGLRYKAYGCMQVRQPAVDDVNKKFGTVYTAEACLGNKSLSIDIFNKYMECYPKNITNEEKARAWNGGGNWKLVYNKKGWETYSKNLDAYWKKVKALLK